MQIPVAVPPNLDPAIAKQVIEYLKANPEAAQQSYEQAHRMLQTPGMAQMLLDAKVMLNCCAVELQRHAYVYLSPHVDSRHLSGNLPVFCRWGYVCMTDFPPFACQQSAGQRSPEQMAKMMQLKEDPELKHVFDDIEANGTTAMEKYWNDTDLMSKISQKMSAMNLGPSTPPRKNEKTKVPIFCPTSLSDEY